MADLGDILLIVVRFKLRLAVTERADRVRERCHQSESQIARFVDRVIFYSDKRVVIRVCRVRI